MHFIHNYTRRLTAFPCGRIQHVRGMRYSIVTMIQSVLKFRFMRAIPHSRLSGYISGNIGCFPFVRINRLGRALNNGKGFSKISKPTERNGAYYL